MSDPFEEVVSFHIKGCLGILFSLLEGDMDIAMEVNMIFYYNRDGSTDRHLDDDDDDVARRSARDHNERAQVKS